MATDMFLKLNGIAGESADDSHKGEIDIQSFSFGVSQTGASAAGGGSGAGKAHFDDIQISKYVDKATPALMLACATGQHIKDGVITFRKAGGKQEEFFKVTLTDLLISTVHNSGTGGDNPTEAVSLNYSKIAYEYSPQGADGALTSKAQAAYDIKANKKA